jgi:uncharacterized protein YbjT (DUF2867 family)
MKTAIVLGASGLVGTELVQQLLNTTEFEKVKIFVRRSLGISNSKLEEQLIDFENLSAWKNDLVGDTLFSCMGTTLKTAGSKEKQYLVDYTYPYQCIEAAIQNGIKQIILVSSIGAKASSSNFYLRMKGELEEAIKKLNPSNFIVFRPSILDGNRLESRPAEYLALKIMRILGKLPFLKKYAPTLVRDLAASMIRLALKDKEGVKVVESLEI